MRWRILRHEGLNRYKIQVKPWWGLYWQDYGSAFDPDLFSSAEIAEDFGRRQFDGYRYAEKNPWHVVPKPSELTDNPGP